MPYSGIRIIRSEQHALDMAGKIKKFLKSMKLVLFTKLHLIKQIEQV